MYEKIQKAVKQIEGVAHRTPVVTCSTLNEKLGAEIFFKCENLQRVGAFKFRGAYNSMSQLDDAQKKAGVIAYSSGNHGQAIACSGKLLNISTVVVMPNNAPAIKKQATKSYGAKVVEYDPQTEDREVVAKAYMESRGGQMTLIPPYNYENVIAGQGTVTVEFLEDCPELEMILMPCGGGGLLSGSAVAAKNIKPSCQIIGVEPELGNDATLSYRTGELHTIHNPPTIADGTRTPSLGSLTFPLIREYVDDMQTVSEEAIKEAVKYVFYRMKLVVEPSGVLGLAAILDGVVKPAAKTGIIFSGGNMDGATLSEIFS